jgi:hypothetical protein
MTSMSIGSSWRRVMPNATKNDASAGALLRIVRITRKRGVTRATVITLGTPSLALIALLGSHFDLAQRIAKSALAAIGVGR